MTSLEIDASGLVKIAEYDGFVGIGTSQSNAAYTGKVEINYPSGAFKGLIVRPSVGGTGNIFEAQSAASGTLVVIDASGEVGINNPNPSAMLDITSKSATTMGTIIKAAASQSADILEIQNSSSTPLFTVDSVGKVGIRTVTPTGTLDITTATSATKGLILRSSTSQNVNLLEYTDPTGAIYGYINSFGELNPAGS
jgi:hypothetical protein